MRMHWRRQLTGLIAAALVALAAGPLSAAASGVTAASPACPNGTHWDNVLQICK